MAEIRVKLIPHLGKRVQVRGCLSAFSDWFKLYRDVGRACIADPEIDGELVAKHVWVMEVPHWCKHKKSCGKQVEFTAVVKEYFDKHNAKNYSLYNADDLKILYDPPALAIPEPKVEQVAELYIPEGVPDPKASSDPKVAVRQVKAFVKACGGLAQAEQVVAAFQDITVPIREVADWLTLLKEE